MLINALWGGIKNNEIKRTVQKWVCEELCQMIWEMKRKWGEGKGGRLNHTFFVHQPVSSDD